jgi:hypothetical protein
MDFSDFRKLAEPKRLLFVLIFGIVALAAYKINFSQLLGAENQFFTLFQFFGPIAGSFLGPFLGAASVLVAEILNFLLAGKAFSWVNLFRLTPMLFAAYYFGKKGSKFVALVPVMCMALFIMHPVGGQIWYYSLYWLIPLAAAFFPNRLFMKSLGATFTAHAVGSIIFLYTLPTTLGLWQMLIPVVAFERVMFALGITFSYIAVNAVLSRLENIVPFGVVSVNRDYLPKNLLRIGA